MTPSETVVLVRTVRAACPQQHLDEYTPDAWYELLGDLDISDAQKALKRIVRRQRFVAPSEIRDEVKAIRDDRLDRDQMYATEAPELPDTSNMTEQARAYIESMRRKTHEAAAGLGRRFAIDRATGPPSADYRRAAHDAWPHRDDMRVRVLAVTCPWRPCRAQPGQACVGPDEHSLRNSPYHDARVRMYEAWAR